jgi:DNA-binding transcriptional regulator YdaS (Cro superfamily)
MVAAKLATLKDGQRQVGQLADVPTQEDAAKLLNVGERSVGRASKVRSKGTPELAQAVEQGRLAVSVAAKAADLPASEQRKLAKRAKKGERVSAKRTDTKGRQQPATKPTVGTTTTVGIAKRLLIYLTAHGLKADPVQVAQMLRESLPGSIDKLDKLVAWLDQFTAELKQQTSKREGVEHA